MLIANDVNRQQSAAKKSIFLVVDFWHMKLECWAGTTKSEVQSDHKKEEYLRAYEVD